EQGRDKKPGKAVQGRQQVIGVHIKEIVGLLQAGVGIEAAAVLRQKRLVLAGLGILVGAQKQHVLEKVSQAIPLGGVLETAHMDTQGGRRLVRLRVGYQQYLEAIGQGDKAVA